MKLKRIVTVVALGVTWLGLAAAPSEAPSETDREALSRPMADLSAAELTLFQQGRSLVRQSWVVAPAGNREVNGLGPLYNRLACISCHPKNGRGGAPDGPQQRMQSMLVRLSVPGLGAHGGPRPHPAYGDQLNEEGIPGVTGEGRAHIRWLTSRAMLAGGESIELRRPRVSFDELGYGPQGKVQVSLRVSPHVAGLGLLET
ncbi:MAG: thiol oxidoreductase, partial [Rhodoferax sp.]|nr:thiol oxidoreductase [Rhodoferax sp.]